MAKSVRVRRRLFKYLPIKKKFVDESRVYDNLLLNREGMVLKPGPHRGRPPARPPDLGELITRYGLVFSPKRYGSRKNALEAALLHAKFYAGLAEKKVMHPQASVFVHNDSRKNPSISVLMPFLTTPKRGDYNSPVLDFSATFDRLELAYPTFRNVHGLDISFMQNYG
ncbi:hypothetical protein HY993_01775, partial [Candidatus Micrarchaeota archaeon]|nr:hypothetical protein [Candidatus Micrarchaeota archaeon]